MPETPEDRCLQGFFIITVMDMRCGQRKNRVVDPDVVHKPEMRLSAPLWKRETIIRNHINTQKRQPLPKGIRHRMRMKIYRHLIFPSSQTL